MEGPKRAGALVVLAGLCCGLPALLASGALAGLWAWVLDGGATAVATAVVVTAALFITVRYLTRRNAGALSKRNLED